VTRHAKAPSAGMARRLSASTVVDRDAAVAEVSYPPSRARVEAKAYGLGTRRRLPGHVGATSNRRVAPATTNQPAGPGRRS
jgi:hypothetical protein